LLTPRNKWSGAIQVQMKDHQVLRTDATGSAALVLNPNVTLQFSSNTELRMDDTDLDHPRATLVRGIGSVSSDFRNLVRGTSIIGIRVGDATIEIAPQQNPLQARIDAETMQIWSSLGRFTIVANDKRIGLVDRRRVDLRTLKVSGFDVNYL